MSIDWPRFAELVRSSHHIMLVSHIRPDCDALGSELGMAAILKTLGKQVRIVNGHVTPPNLAFIDPAEQIKTIGVHYSAEEALAGIDLIMILDTSAWAQIGPMSEVIQQASCAKCVLDHHVGEDDLGAEMFKNVKAEAAGRLVVEAADALGVALTAEIATPLFAAIATDTGWYRFGSADAYTYRMAARLIEAGAKPSDIYRQLYEQDTLARVKLRGRILAHTTAELEGRLVWTAVRQIDFQETGALPSDTEDVVNMTLAIAGTEFAVIFVEQATGGFKISFRSRCHLNCNDLAKQFGGGGHKAAAGAFYVGTFEEARDAILTVVRNAMQENS